MLISCCAEKLDVDDMQMETGKYDGTKQYAKDKRRMVAYAEQFARRWQVRCVSSGVAAASSATCRVVAQGSIQQATVPRAVCPSHSLSTTSGNMHLLLHTGQRSRQLQHAPGVDGDCGSALRNGRTL